MRGARSQELPERLNSASHTGIRGGFPIITPKSRLRQELSGSFVESVQGPDLGPALSAASALLRPSLYLLPAVSVPLPLPSKKKFLLFNHLQNAPPASPLF